MRGNGTQYLESWLNRAIENIYIDEASEKIISVAYRIIIWTLKDKNS